MFPLTLGKEGVSVVVTPFYISWVCGQAEHLEHDWFWLERGASDTDSRQIASNFAELINALLNERTAMSLPIGTIVLAVNTQPDWLRCDGSPIDQALYPALWEVLYPYRGLDNIVRLPDLVGRVAVGAGIFNDADGILDLDVLEKGGERNHKLTISEMPKHSHGPKAPSTQIFGNGGINAALAPGTGVAVASLTDSGGDGSHNNMQPYTALYYVIKAK